MNKKNQTITKTVKKATITHLKAQETVWRAMDTLRGRSAIDENCETILDLLLWADIVPTTQDGLIGYFDAMQSISEDNSWVRIKAEIDKACGRPQDARTKTNKISLDHIELLRTMLLPLTRAIAGGSREDKKIIAEALLKTREKIIGKAGNFDCSYSMGQFWKEVCKDESNTEIACLFPMGVGASTYLSNDHKILTHTANTSQERWLKGIAKLLSQETNIIDPNGGWAISIACPPWREMSKEQVTNDPWLNGAELECPDSINDIEARKIYTAHRLCTDKTYAVTSPAIGFSGSKDLELFRQELIKQNWLDAIIELPAGVHPGTNIGGLLLILNHNRKANDKVAIISGERLLPKGKSKGTIEWETKAIKELASLLKERKASEICKLVETKEIKDNGYKLQTSRYLKTEDETAIETYLESRNTLKLGDIAEIKRPLASLSKKADDGILLREVTLSDINNSGLIQQGSKAIQIPEAVIAKSREQLLNEGDVLLSIKGSIGKVSAVGKLEEQTVPGQAFCVVKLRSNAPLSATALVQYLRSEIGKFLFQKRTQGTGVAFIPMGEVKNLPVVIPNKEEAERSEQISETCSELSEKLNRLTHQLETISNQGWLHNLPQTRSSRAR